MLKASVSGFVLVRLFKASWSVQDDRHGSIARENSGWQCRASYFVSERKKDERKIIDKYATAFPSITIISCMLT